MQANENRYPLDCIRNTLRRHISRFDCMLFAAAFVMTLLVHMYMFTHKFINHDDIGGLYSDGDYGIYSGRWLIRALTGFTGNLSSTWIIGAVSALFLAGAVVLIARLFRMYRYIPALLMAGCLVAFPVIASTYSYMFSAVPYCFSIFCAAAAACLIQTKRWPLMAAGSVAVALAMGCYQSYFCLAVALLLLVFGLELLDDCFGGSWKNMLRTGISYVAFLLAGMILYFIILKISLYVQNASLVSYQGLDGMGQVGLMQLLRRIPEAYAGFRAFFTDAYDIFHPFFTPLFCVAVLLSAAEFGYEVIRKKLWQNPANVVFMAIAVILFPLACSLVYVMVDSRTADVHLLMLYPLVLPLILPAIALNRLEFPSLDCTGLKKNLCILLAVALVFAQTIIGYECFLITNRAYFAMDLIYENTYAYYTKLTAKIELQEGYTPDTPVAFIGQASTSEYVPQTHMIGIWNLNFVLNIYTIPHYLRYFLASDYTFVSQQQEDKIAATETYQNMPCYPEAGSIRTIDGVIVVKFS